MKKMTFYKKPTSKKATAPVGPKIYAIKTAVVAGVLILRTSSGKFEFHLQTTMAGDTLARWRKAHEAAIKAAKAGFDKPVVITPEGFTPEGFELETETVAVHEEQEAATFEVALSDGRTAVATQTATRGMVGEPMVVLMFHIAGVQVPSSEVYALIPANIKTYLEGVERELFAANEAVAIAWVI